MSMKKGEQKSIICEYCNKSFSLPLYRFSSKRSMPRFCSILCRATIMGYQSVKKYNSYINCLNCNKEIHYPPSQERKGRKFCSKHCSGIFNIKNLETRMLGKTHSLETKNKMSKSNLGKNIKPLSQRKMSVANSIRETREYKDWWRWEIFLQDNFTCRSCGQIGGRLNVHHIIPLSVIIKYVSRAFGKNNLLENVFNFPLTFDMKNGITLCEDCHKKTDSFLSGAKSKVVLESSFFKIEEELSGFFNRYLKI